MQMTVKKKKLLPAKPKADRTRTAMQRRQHRQEDLRETLQAKAYLNNLNKIHDRLKSKWHLMTNEQTAASKLQADINFRLLSKCLPDLRQIEINGELNHMHHDMSRAEIDGMLLAEGIDPSEAFEGLKIVGGN